VSSYLKQSIGNLLTIQLSTKWENEDEDPEFEK
jgi:hypothetical protein